MTDMVNHPPHYQALHGVNFECIQLARRLTFDAGNAVKYMWRTDRKNGREDVEKARWYIDDAIKTQDAVFDMSHLYGQRQDTAHMLITVADAQDNLQRARFFEALSTSSLVEALAALDSILGGAS